MASENRDVDHYSLDDTLLGRVVQAALAGTFVAVPEFTSSTAGRVGSRLAILVGGGVLVAVLNAMDEDDGDEPELPEDDAASPAVTWGIAAAALAGSLGLGPAEKALARWLRRRGASRPHALLGAGVAATVFVASEAQHRAHEAG